jgi:hypothetical protein
MNLFITYAVEIQCLAASDENPLPRLCLKSLCLAWKRSVPPAIAGGCVAAWRPSITSYLWQCCADLCIQNTELLAHPPAIAGGTDSVQDWGRT